MAGLDDKDRRHYGVCSQDVVMEVTPVQAATWLHSRPPAPYMWSRGAANNERARRYAEAMAAGAWEVDRPVEPVAIWEDHQCILGGHHRLTAVTMIGRPQALRVRFYHKPHGWDLEFREARDRETMARFNSVPRCPVCSWPTETADAVEAHLHRVHKERAA
jgi:hypothetical protein